MKILGIDSSGLVASVAMMSENTMIAEFTINNKQTHSQTLLPMLDSVVQRSGVALEEVDAIAIAAGPGSFTGLRIGAATAKGLGLVLEKPIIGVSALEGLAYNIFGTDKLICPIMDARRNQVYTALYEYQGDELVEVIEPKVILIDEIIAAIHLQQREVIFVGDGIPVFDKLIQEKLEVSFQFAPPHLSRQRAGSIAALGLKYYAKGIYETAAEHKPIYLRISQAERELKEKMEQGCL